MYKVYEKFANGSKSLLGTFDTAREAHDCAGELLRAPGRDNSLSWAFIEVWSAPVTYDCYLDAENDEVYCQNVKRNYTKEIN